MNETIQSPSPESAGRRFNNLAEVNEALTSSKKEGQGWGTQYLIVHGKRIHKLPPKTEGGQPYYDLVDDPSSSIKAMFGRQDDRRLSMNIYEGQKVVYWFNITDDTIRDYQIEVGQIHYQDYKEKQ